VLLLLTLAFGRRLLFFIGLEDFLYIDSRELMRILSVGSPAGGTKTRFGLPNAVPTPHAHLVAAFARIKLAVRKIEFFAAQRAYAFL
jgi:hypothetical protein